MLSRKKLPEIVFTTWALLALAALLPVARLLNGASPIFTVVWILIPLGAVLLTKDASRIGFCTVPWRQLVQTTAINLGGLLALMLLFEPWSHTYQRLLALALSSQPPDTTFAWLLRFPQIPALGAMTLYSGLVTLFGEELFFRGWLLQLFQKRLGATRAVVFQALLFVIPNLLVAFALPALQGALYVLIYNWLAIGMLGGWAASRTGSIWPSLISATLCNLILVGLITCNTVPASTPGPVPKSSYEASNTTLYVATENTLAVGYADFNRDGRQDLLMAYVSGTTETTPIKMFLQNSIGAFIEDASLFPSPVPGTVHARKAVIADFNGDNVPDAFIADHGYDRPPFPGAEPVFLLSRADKFEMKPILNIPIGFQHSATAADINGDTAVDVFVTDTTNGAFLLMNDGTGNFVVTRQGIPLLKDGYYTSELIDIDDDGNYDLLVGGHEHERAATRIYWGDGLGIFSASRAALIPGDAEYPIVLDFDAEDLDGDGIRELVLTRTKSNPFYQGYYFQILQLSNGQVTDVSTRIASDRVAWEGAASEWVAWITLCDFNGNGFRDIVAADKGRALIYLNDGQGNFTKKP